MTNLEIAQAAKLRPIQDVAIDAGLTDDDFEPLGRFKAKFTDGGIAKLKGSEGKGKLVLVTAMTPTIHGEGKTTVTIGLTQGLCRIGKRAVSATREPALGPIFGMKGGACGGGYSQVLPMEDINLFFTGDFPAIAAAHNLLSALIDAHIHHKNPLGIDTRQVTWPRTVDMNDRALREIIVGLGGVNGGYPRESGFVITPASEVMAVLCLARDLADLKARLGRLIIGLAKDRSPLTAADIHADGAMAVLLKDAIRPNLVQTIEGGLAIVHGGPFGNIAHGCSSILGTEVARGLGDYVVTEAGFGADLGGEKFLNIVAPELGYGPDCIVLVVTIKAIQHHGGSRDLAGLKAGFANVLRHTTHLQHYGVPLVLALNQFADDSEEDKQALADLCQEHGLDFVVSNPFGEGGVGCTALAEVVQSACNKPSTFTSLHQTHDSIAKRLETTARVAYGANGVVFSDVTERRLRWAEKHGFGTVPVCVAKTQYSLSDDPTKINAPTDFDIHIRDIKFSAGAGFAVAIAGDVMLMPGLGESPAAHRIDITADGTITGLF